jgi:hypothetical protein
MLLAEHLVDIFDVVQFVALAIDVDKLQVDLQSIVYLDRSLDDRL